MTTSTPPQPYTEDRLKNSTTSVDAKGGSASPPADDLRAGGQPEDCQGAWADGATIDPCPRRRGHRIAAASIVYGHFFSPDAAQPVRGNGQCGARRTVRVG